MNCHVISPQSSPLIWSWDGAFFTADTGKVQVLVRLVISDG